MTRTESVSYNSKQVTTGVDTKHKKHILEKEASDYLKEVFRQIAKEYAFGIDTLGVLEDHVHISLLSHRRYNP